MLANTPIELRSEMIDRINSSDKNQNNHLEDSDGSKVLKILKKSVNEGGFIERKDIEEKGSETGFGNFDINIILSMAEAEGILVRAGKDTWKLIEP
tara:strand:- start:27 stop:314 length:288 start_codon:yes stop_codon:yes gene_type:complete